MPVKVKEGRGAGIIRTVRLAAELLGGRELTKHQAAEILDIKPPAAKEQLRALQRSLPGVVSEVRQRVRYWSYRSSPSTWDLPSVIAACFGSSLASLFRGSSYAENLDQVRTRIIDGAARRSLFKNIERKFLFHSQGGDEGIHRTDSVLDEVVDGLLREVELRISYENFSGKKERLTVTPLALVLYQHQLYLVARRKDGSLHPYRLARITAADLGASFIYPADFSPEQVFADSFGVWLGQNSPPVEVVLRLDAKWATFARTHQWHSTQRTHIEADHVVVRIRCRPCEELNAWVLSFGGDAEVIEPGELRQEIASRVAKAASIYAGG